MMMMMAHRKNANRALTGLPMLHECINTCRGQQGCADLPTPGDGGGDGGGGGGGDAEKQVAGATSGSSDAERSGWEDEQMARAREEIRGIVQEELRQARRSAAADQERDAPASSQQHLGVEASPPEGKRE